MAPTDAVAEPGAVLTHEPKETNKMECSNNSVASSPTCDALNAILASTYKLENPHCQLIQATMRAVYRVETAGQRYALFIYPINQRTPEEIEAEWNFIDYLHRHEAPVAPAIRHTKGDLLLALDTPDGTRYAVLSEFVDGQHLRHRYSLGATRLYGRAIATIHTLADAAPMNWTRPANNFEFVVQQSLTALAPLLGHRPDTMRRLQDVAAHIQPAFSALPATAPYFGMIHGDVIRANAQVGDGGTVTVLDFDLCGPGWRAYDVASYLQVAPTEESRCAFIDGYQEIRALSPEEYALLPAFEAARHIFSLGIPATHIESWGSQFLDEAAIDRTVEQLQKCLA